jgi:hypothetical protein
MPRQKIAETNPVRSRRVADSTVAPSPRIHHQFERMDVLQRQEAAGTKTPKKDAEPEPDQFTYRPGLNLELRKRFNQMVIALKSTSIAYGTMSDVRPTRTAHILSTGYHIHTKQAIPLSSLQALKDGKDLDDNTWYKKEWEVIPPVLWGDPEPAGLTDILAKARENAFTVVKAESPDVVNEPLIGANTINCAYEGYETSDAHRKPNVFGVPISNHVKGLAIDLKGIDWSKFGGPWSSDATAFVAGFGLARPYVPGGTTYCIEEPWHFELAAASAK